MHFAHQFRIIETNASLINILCTIIQRKLSGWLCGDCAKSPCHLATENNEQFIYILQKFLIKCGFEVPYLKCKIFRCEQRLKWKCSITQSRFDEDENERKFLKEWIKITNKRLIWISTDIKLKRAYKSDIKISVKLGENPFYLKYRSETLSKAFTFTTHFNNSLKTDFLPSN